MDIILRRILKLLGEKHGAVKELADGINISANIISNWKNGTNKSYTKYLAQIAEYYGVSLDWLSGNSDTKESASTAAEADNEMLELLEAARHNPGMKILFSLGKNATPEQLKTYIDVIKAMGGKEDGNCDY